METAYHPESDSQTEVVNRCLEAYLRCFAQEQPKSWSHFLAWAENSFNTGYHYASNMTPFQIVYGQEPPVLHPFISEETKIAQLE